jgi:uncharacterized protein
VNSKNTELNQVSLANWGTRAQQSLIFLKAFFCLIVFLFTIHYSLFTAFALEVPALKGHVNDYANMMSQETRLKIENELKAFEQSDSTQIVILTIPSLEGEVLEQFSIKVAEAWKIGQKGKDNGAILLVSLQDRKTRIEVGRGLEGKLTDLMAGRIVNSVINPRFKGNDFDGGFIAATQALIDATRGEFKVDETQAPARKTRSTPLPVLFIFGAIALLTLGRISRVLGGAAGGIGFSLIGLFMGFPLIAIILIGVLGLGMGILLPLLLGGFGGGGGFFPGGFGGFGGGGFGGDGGDSGGFGGGGGDFGGGGASGDW